MKTINDLVAKLNRYVAYGKFYIRKGKNDNYLLCKRYTEGEDATLFEFAKKQPYWSIHQPLGAMHNQVQKDIMDFIYTTDKEHWFDKPEKKYNIIIGIECAYTKTHDGIEIQFLNEENDLMSDMFMFTESEIEELKSKLPENMAKIVDLGKVEVKDD